MEKKGGKHAGSKGHTSEGKEESDRMKRKQRRKLAGLLAIILLISTSNIQAFAGELPEIDLGVFFNTAVGEDERKPGQEDPGKEDSGGRK